MNSLSWFLYAVDVFASLEVISEITLIVCLTGLLMLPLIVSTAPRAKEDKEGFHNKCKKIAKTTFKFVAIPALVAVVLVPSPRTMYLMLGSEVGEEVAMSETAKRVQDAVNKKLDEYLGGEK